MYINNLKEKTGEVKIKGEKICCVHFVDDIIILAESEDDMNFTLTALVS